MTKARDPQTVEDAILRIVDRIGWAAAADVVGKGERVVRNWSDPDFDRRPDIEEAMLLDRAYLSAGGGTAPLLAVYAAKVGREITQEADSAQIALATGVAAKEAGEAIASAVTASMPGATRQSKAVAAKEIKDAIEALHVLEVTVAPAVH